MTQSQSNLLPSPIGPDAARRKAVAVLPGLLPAALTGIALLLACGTAGCDANATAAVPGGSAYSSKNATTGSAPAVVTTSAATIPDANAPTLAVVLIDPTVPPEAGYPAFRASLERSLFGCLPDGSEIAVVRAGLRPRVIACVSARQAAEVRSALDRAAAVQDDCGSDPASALEVARMLCSRDQYARTGFRRLVIGWTDLHPDPCKELTRARKRTTGVAAGDCRAPRDPALLPADLLRDVEVHLYGVPKEEQERLAQGAATGRFHCYLPGESLSPETLGLHPRPL